MVRCGMPTTAKDALEATAQAIAEHEVLSQFAVVRHWEWVYELKTLRAEFPPIYEHWCGIRSQKGLRLLSYTRIYPRSPKKNMVMLL